MEYAYRYASPLGGITMTSDGESLTGLSFDGHGSSSPKNEGILLPVFEDATKWLDTYFEGRSPGFTPALRFKSTSFRENVWKTILSIPYGHTVTYGEIAGRIAVQYGVPRMSAQAVGAAAGCNPILLIVPCHRVVGSGGRLTGYSCGIEIKKRLLEIERPAPLPYSTEDTPDPREKTSGKLFPASEEILEEKP